MKLTTITVIAFIFVLFSVSCNDPLFLGSDLLKQDQVGIGFTDTLSLSTKTIRQDSLLVYDPSVKVLDAFLIGKYKDPQFGLTDASAFLQYRLGNTLSPDFKGASFDSLVLGMVYDTLHNYGNYKQMTSLSAYRITEDMSALTAYKTDQKFMVDPVALGSVNFIPDPNALSTYYEYFNGYKDTVSSNQIRIRLSDVLGNELMNAPDSTYSKNDNFLKVFKGLQLKAETETGGIMSFNPLDINSKITLFYSRNDTSYQYEFTVTSLSARTVSFVHDYSGTKVEQLLASTADSDTLAMLQGMLGTLVKIDIPNLDSLKGKIINKAELEFYIKTFDNESAIYPPIQNVLLAYKNTLNKYVSVNDVLLAFSSGSLAGLNKYFGGTVIEESINGVQLFKYKMNISSHLQYMIQNKVGKSMYLTVYRRAETANRVALYGTGSHLPPKLRVSFTNEIL